MPPAFVARNCGNFIEEPKKTIDILLYGCIRTVELGQRRRPLAGVAAELMRGPGVRRWGHRLQVLLALKRTMPAAQWAGDLELGRPRRFLGWRVVAFGIE